MKFSGFHPVPIPTKNVEGPTKSTVGPDYRVTLVRVSLELSVELVPLSWNCYRLITDKDTRKVFIREVCIFFKS